MMDETERRSVNSRVAHPRAQASYLKRSKALIFTETFIAWKKTGKNALVTARTGDC